jgi:hypothetical protein
MVSFQVKYISGIKTKASRPFRKRFHALRLILSEGMLRIGQLHDENTFLFVLQGIFSLHFVFIHFIFFYLSIFLAGWDDFADKDFLYTSNTMIIGGLRCQ